MVSGCSLSWKSLSSGEPRECGLRIQNLATGILVALAATLMLLETGEAAVD